MKIFFTLFILILFAAPPAIAQHYYSQQEVLAYLYPNSQNINFEKKSLSASQLSDLMTQLKTKDIKTEWTVYIARSGKKIDGYALIDNVLGKEKPITFVISISPEGRINEVEILEYRESHGGQVKNKAYRKQFEGKSVSDPLKVGQDIRNVSGATISSNNVAFGVKKALAVWQVFYAASH